jgi:hypothetical protein
MLKRFVLSGVSLAALALGACARSSAPTAPVAASAPGARSSTAIASDFTVTLEPVVVGGARTGQVRAQFAIIPDARDGVQATNPPGTLQVSSQTFVGYAGGAGGICGVNRGIQAPVTIDSFLTEQLTAVHTEIAEVPTGHESCVNDALPVNQFGQISGAGTTLGLIDYADLAGATASDGLTMGGSASKTWAFLYPDDASFIVRGRIWAEPHPPPPGIEQRTHLEAGQPLRWYVGENVPSGVLEIATDAAFTSTVDGDSNVVVAKETTPVGRRIFVATNVYPANPLSYRYGEAPETFGVFGAEPTGWSVGLLFSVDRPGRIRGVWYYRGPNETAMPATPNVALYDPASGTALATATSTPETSAGWQYQAFATAYAIQPNKQYLAARFVPSGSEMGDTPGAFLYGGYDKVPFHVPQYATRIQASSSLVFPNDPAFAPPNCSVTTTEHMCGRNVFVDVDFVDEAEFSRLPVAATGAGPYYWRVRNRFTGTGGTTVNGTLVTAAAGSFVPTTGPTFSGSDLQFTTGPAASLATVEVCMDASEPIDRCYQPLLQRDQTLTVTGSQSYTYNLGTPGTFWWRVTQQFPTGIGVPSAWQGPVTRIPLTVNVVGNPGDYINVLGSDFGCNATAATCGTAFALNQNVTLYWFSTSGAKSVTWGGACTGTADTCVVTMDAAKTVTGTLAH